MGRTMQPSRKSQAPVKRKASEVFENKQDEKRIRTQFQPRKIIGPRDIVTNQNFCKVKMDEEAEQIFNSVIQANQPQPPIINSNSKRVSWAFPPVKFEKVHESTMDSPSEPQEVRVVKEEVDIPMGYNEADTFAWKSFHEHTSIVGKQTMVKIDTVTKDDDKEQIFQREPRQETLATTQRISWPDDKCLAGDLTVSEPESLSTVSFENSENDAVQQEKVITLFAQVLKVYWTKFAHPKTNNRQYLNFNCRLACKSWKQGMDSILKNVIGINASVEIKLYNGNANILEETAHSFLRMYKNIPWPSLRPTELTIHDMPEYSNVDQISRCRSAISGLLEEFGRGIQKFHHVGHAHHKFQYISLTDWYTTFRNWLEMMPNLKELNLHHHFIPGEDRMLDQRKVAELQESVRLHPVPKLEHLSSCNIPGEIVLLPVLSNILITNNHVQKVYFKWFFNLEKFSFPNLTDINFGVVYGTDIAQMPLVKHSSSRVDIDFVSGFIDPAGMLDVVEGFGFLKSLSICFPPHRWSFRSLKMPYLKAFSIQIDENLDQQRSLWTAEVILKIVSPMKSLEKLSVYNVDLKKLGWIKKPEKKRALQVKRCLKNRLVFRLWELLPTLRQVELQPALPRNVSIVNKPFLFIRQTYMY